MTVTAWKKSYALIPKRIESKWVWFEHYYWREVWVEVRVQSRTYTEHEWRKEYGTLFDVLSSDGPTVDNEYLVS